MVGGKLVHVPGRPHLQWSPHLRSRLGLELSEGLLERAGAVDGDADRRHARAALQLRDLGPEVRHLIGKVDEPRRVEQECKRSLQQLRVMSEVRVQARAVPLHEAVGAGHAAHAARLVPSAAPT